jgi:hypothetical protein
MTAKVAGIFVRPVRVLTNRSTEIVLKERFECYRAGAYDCTMHFNDPIVELKVNMRTITENHCGDSRPDDCRHNNLCQIVVPKLEKIDNVLDPNHAYYASAGSLYQYKYIK